jgi:hypothetical protein
VPCASPRASPPRTGASSGAATEGGAGRVGGGGGALRAAWGACAFTILTSNVFTLTEEAAGRWQPHAPLPKAGCTAN